MPADGDAFIADGRRMVGERDAIVGACDDATRRRLAEWYLDVIAPSAKDQPKSIVSRCDMFRPDRPEDEAAGTWLYKYLSVNYRVP